MYSLKGQKISCTYDRLVQNVSGSYYDGLGNLLNINTGSISDAQITSSSDFILTNTSQSITMSLAKIINVTASYALSGLMFGNIDGGTPSSIYGTSTAIVGGTP